MHSIRSGTTTSILNSSSSSSFSSDEEDEDESGSNQQRNETKNGGSIKLNTKWNNKKEVATVQRFIIYQLDLMCQAESASLEEQGRHILYYYSQNDDDALKFSGFCQATCNFSSLLCTTSNNNNNGNIDVEQVHLSNASELIYIPLPEDGNINGSTNNNNNHNNVMAVLQIQQRRDCILDSKSIRQCIQTFHLFFQILYNQREQRLYLKSLYTKRLEEISLKIQHKSFHTIVHCTPSRDYYFGRSLCSNLAMKSFLYQLTHAIQSLSTAESTVTLHGASVFHNNTFVDSCVLPSSSFNFFKNDTHNGVTIIHLLYKHMMEKLLRTIHSTKNPKHRQGNNGQQQHFDHDGGSSSTSANSYCKKKSNKQSYWYSTNDCIKQSSADNKYIHNNDTAHNIMLDLFTTTPDDNDPTDCFIWAPTIHTSSSSFCRVAFFHDKHGSCSIMFYLMKQNDVDTTNNFIRYCDFIQQLSMTLQQLNFSPFGIPCTTTSTASNTSTSNSHTVASNTFPFWNPKIDEGIHMIVSIDRYLGRSVTMLPEDSSANTNRNTSFLATMTGVVKTLANSSTSLQQSVVVLNMPEDALRHRLANIQTQEVAIALDDVMSEIRSNGKTSCTNILPSTTNNGSVHEVCLLFAHGSTKGNANNVWICGRRLGDRELYVVLDCGKYKTVRHVQQALSRIRTDLLHLPYS